MAAVTLTFEDGSVRLEGLDRAGVDPADLPGVEADPRSKSHRAPAFEYAVLRAALGEAGVAVEDRVLDLPSLDLSTAYDLRPYQEEALAAWRAADDRGVLEMPTGSGKTVVGLAAMAALSTPTLVVAPTLDLVRQWRTELEREFGAEVGQVGGGEQTVGDVTVATYDSAYLRAAELGDRFGLAVFDEVHHLGGEGYRDVARLLAAPARLGLTATFERPDGAHEAVAALVGERVVSLDPEDLAGEHLAAYDVRRVEVELTDEERAVYDDHQETFLAYVREAGITFESGSDYQELVKRSGNDPRAREALLAKQRAREVMLESDAKVDALADVLADHREDRVIVFCAHTDTVYRLSERFLLPAVTGETPAAEREEILGRFRDGTYSRVVTANVLDEGVDVPDANVAVVVAGTGSERQFTQRLGRVLRPKDGGVSESSDSEARESTESSLGGRALLYEIVSAETAEERVAERRR